MEGLDDSSDEYGGHKRTRFPFLATARYVAAAVVSVLTVVVVVMVIIVALRPEKVIFSISHKYIEADRLWWWVYANANDNSMAPAPAPAPAVQTTNVGRRLNAGTAAAAAATTTVPVTINPSLGSTETTTTYSAVELVYLWVSLTADNPSGRADITGENNFTVSVFDRPGGSFPVRREIVTYELQDRFPLNRQTSRTLEKWVLVNDKAVLSYLADTYGGLTSFPAMVRVNATIVGWKQPQVYYCWPVTVGTYSGNDNSAPCRPEKEMDSPFSLAPAPAPTAAAL